MKFLKYILYMVVSVCCVACGLPFDLDLDDDPIIFLECFPGVDDVVAFRILPAYSRSNSFLKPDFAPDIVLTVNGEEVPVVLNLDNCISGKYDDTYYIADYRPVSGDKMRVEVTSEGFEPVYAETVIPEVFPSRRIDYRRVLVGEEEQNILYVTPDAEPDDFYAYGLQLVRETIWDFADSVKVFTSTYIGSQIEDDYDLSPDSMNGMSVSFYDSRLAVWRSDFQKDGSGEMLMVLLSYHMYGESSFEDFYVHENERIQYDEYMNEIGTYKEIIKNRLKLYTLSEEFYKYMVAQQLVESNAGFIAGLAPSNFCYSNVKGGYGAFAGVSAVETDWITPEFIENNR